MPPPPQNFRCPEIDSGGFVQLLICRPALCVAYNIHVYNLKPSYAPP